MKSPRYLSALTFFIVACRSTQQASPVAYTGPTTHPSTTDDPGDLATVRREAGELWRTAVDVAHVPDLAVEADSYAIHGRFQGDQLIVVFRLPEPDGPTPWTLVVDGQTLEREIHDADAHPRGGAWVQVERDERPSVPGMVYGGAFSVDVRALIVGDAAAPGAAVIVRFGAAQARIVR